MSGLKTIYSRNIFIDSETNVVRDGFAYRVNFPQEPFSILPGQKMKLTLTSYDQRRNWFSVNQTNNKFFFAVKDDRNIPAAIKFYEVLIPPGSYQSFMELCLAIQSGLNTALTGDLLTEGVYSAGAIAKVGYEGAEPNTGINDGSTDLTSSKHYLVQVKTTKMVNKECPVMVSQVVPASEFDSGAGTFTGDWRHMTSMACGVIPCNSGSLHHFNVWFKPNETIKAGSKFWFNWWIPQTTAPGVIQDTGPVNATLPTTP